MPRVIHPPKLPQAPDRFPLEDRVDVLLDRLAVALEKSAFMRTVRRIEDNLPALEATEISSPFGTVKAPRFELPSFEPPQMDDRRKHATKAAIVQDLTTLIELIPIAGEILADVIGDAYFRNIHETLTPEEFETFKRLDITNPSTVAMLRTFVVHRR